MTGIQCQIRVRGNLGTQWSDWFDGLTITNDEVGEATLTGVLVDDAALYGTLMKIRDLGLVLLAVSRITACEKQGENT
jgi:hypothetical protein